MTLLLSLSPILVVAIFLASGRRLTRWEGAVLLIGYVGYTTYLFW